MVARTKSLSDATAGQKKESLLGHMGNWFSAKGSQFLAGGLTENQVTTMETLLNIEGNGTDPVTKEQIVQISGAAAVQIANLSGKRDKQSNLDRRAYELVANIAAALTKIVDKETEKKISVETYDMVAAMFIKCKMSNVPNACYALTA